MYHKPIFTPQNLGYCTGIWWY